MDLRHLRQLVAISELGSFARAAKALNLAQPSLTKSIARLEDELKVKLVHRSASGSELTPVGSMVVQRAVRVLQEAKRLTRDAELAAGGALGQLRLGVGTALAGAFLRHLMIATAQRHPRLKLHLEVNDRDRLIADLRNQDLDVIFVADGPELDDPDLERRALVEAEIVVLMSPGHPLANRSVIELHEFLAYPNAGPAAPRFTNLEVLGLDDVAEDNTLFTGNDYAAMLTVVEAGLAIVLAPAFVAADAITAGRLLQTPLDRPPVIAFAAACARAAYASPVIQSVIEEGVAAAGRLKVSLTVFSAETRPS